MVNLSSEQFTGMNGDVMQFMHQLKIWALLDGKSDVDVVMMVKSFVGQTYIRLVRNLGAYRCEK